MSSEEGGGSGWGKKLGDSLDRSHLSDGADSHTHSTVGGFTDSRARGPALLPSSSSNWPSSAPHSLVLPGAYREGA